MMRIPYCRLKALAFAYCGLPVLLFLLLWLKVGWALTLGIVFGGTLAKVLKPNDGRAVRLPFRQPLGTSEVLRLSKVQLAAIVLIVLAWCLIGGQGGMFYQTNDWGIRNAIFRDLLTHSWPVYYNNGTAAMSYYIGFWLPVAAIGKTLLWLGVDLNMAWSLSNFLLLVWTTLGMLLVILLALASLGLSHRHRTLLWALMIVLFSTPDAVGATLTKYWPNAIGSVLLDVEDYRHLEWWSTVAQFSSFTTCLFWVFNQSVIPWICTLLFINERDIRLYFLIFLLCAFSGPLPAIGLAPLMLAQGVRLIIDYGGSKGFLGNLLHDALSVYNVVALLCLIPVVLFLISNAAVGHTGEAPAPNLLNYPLWFPVEAKYIKRLVAFVAIEGLLVPLLMLRDYYRSTLYWGVVLVLVACPFIRVGQAADFCMRASIPALMALYVLCVRSLVSHFSTQSEKDLVSVALALALLVGSITPALEIYRNASLTLSTGVFHEWHDSDTLEGRDFAKSNFGCSDPSNQMFFRVFGE